MRHCSLADAFLLAVETCTTGNLAFPDVGLIFTFEAKEQRPHFDILQGVSSAGCCRRGPLVQVLSCSIGPGDLTQRCARLHVTTSVDRAAIQQPFEDKIHVEKTHVQWVLGCK